MTSYYVYSFSNSLPKQCAYRLHVSKLFLDRPLEMLELRICHFTAYSFCEECCERGNVNATLHLLQLAEFCDKNKIKSISIMAHHRNRIFKSHRYTAVRILLSKDRHGSLTLHCIDFLRISPWWKFRLKLAFIRFLCWFY